MGELLRGTMKFHLPWFAGAIDWAGEVFEERGADWEFAGWDSRLLQPSEFALPASAAAEQMADFESFAETDWMAQLVEMAAEVEAAASTFSEPRQD